MLVDGSIPAASSCHPTVAISIRTPRTHKMSVPAETAAADAKHRLNESALNLLRLASIRNYDIWPALNAHIRLRAFRRVATVLLALVAFVAFVAYVPTLNWTAAAIGRMVLIRGVLPFWDWRHLDDDLCLWRKQSAAAYQAQSDVGDGGDEVTDWDQEQSCVYCEQIGKTQYSNILF